MEYQIRKISMEQNKQKMDTKSQFRPFFKFGKYPKQLTHMRHSYENKK